MDLLATKNTQNDIDRALCDLPKSLNRTYDEALHRITGQNDDDAQLGLRIISWILHACRPLSVNELRHALAVVPGKGHLDAGDLVREEILEAVCAGLVIIDEESNIIRLVHYTTEKYFESRRQELFTDADSVIAEICLTYLSFDAFKVGPCSAENEMATRLEEHPLLPYAAQYWGIHVHGDLENANQELVLKFLLQESSVTSAVQAMSVPDNRYLGHCRMSPQFFHGLWLAARFGLASTMDLLLKNGCKADQETSDKARALHEAANNGSEKAVQLLLRNGASIEAKDKYNETALYKAARKGHLLVVELLLEAGARASTKAKSERTALHEAASNGHTLVADLLLKKGANIAAATIPSAWTPLHGAVGSGNEEMVALLLKAGANVKAKASDGQTAVHVAARSASRATFSLLLEHGGSTRERDKNGDGPLSIACRSGNDTVTELLLSQKVWPSPRNCMGETPLHLAARRGDVPSIQLLLDKGANIKARAAYGKMMLHQLTAQNEGQTGRQLLLAKMAADPANDGGFTALHEAASHGHEQAVRLLLQRGAEVTATTFAGKTALQLTSGHESVTLLLEEAEANTV